MGGRPFVANTQSAVFSPFSWPTYILPFWDVAGGDRRGLKLFIAALGDVPARRARSGCASAARCWPGSSSPSGRSSWSGSPGRSRASSPLVPVAARCSARSLVRRPGPLPAAGLAGARRRCSSSAGHPESTFHAMFAVASSSVRAADPRAARARGVARARPAGRHVRAGARRPAPRSRRSWSCRSSSCSLRSGDLEPPGRRPAGHWPRKYLGALFLHDYWGRADERLGHRAVHAVLRGWYAGALHADAGGRRRSCCGRTRERIAVAVLGGRSAW